MSRLYRSLEW